MSTHLVIGGGAAGFFGAIACARSAPPGSRILLVEKGGHFLSKVRISGGGRCNVTHACFDPRALSTRYPRGGRALIGPFHRFQPRDTVAWFAEHGVALKTEADGRMFPTTDDSQTIIDCLLSQAQAAGVETRLRCGVEALEPRPQGGFTARLSTGEMLEATTVLLATGGHKGGAGDLLAALGHEVEPPVPSLFTFHIEAPWVRALAGVATEVEAAIPGTKLKERGPLLFTHWGVSGPAILRLSAWGARLLHERGYRFPLTLGWLPGETREAITARLRAQREAHPGATVANTPLRPLPTRLWEALVEQAGILPETRWAILPRPQQEQLASLLHRVELPVTGKSTHKAEFVTCGGVRLGDVDFRTMESRIAPGLHFAGEVLDVDGITGGFNFQAAWTTGWLAGHAMAAQS